MSPSGSNANAGTEANPWQTLAFAVGQLSSGDTLHARAGIYGERLLLTGKSGTAVQRIVIRNYEGETPVIDGTSIVVPAGGRQGLVGFTNCSYLTFQGFEVRNFETTAGGRIPVGIQVEGSGTGLEIRNNVIHKIWQSSTNSGANGFGVSVYGSAATAIDQIVLDGNEVYDLRTGQSESVVLNGNVTNFTVSHNVVHDCNNIGIDFIGYEGSAPAAVDRARDGVCVGNTVYNVDSAFNPGYEGDFTSGGGERSAAGIYVDGGTNIVVERNHCYGCNFGIELASEDAAGFTDYIVLRNNLVHHNMIAGLIMGGYDEFRGKTRFCKVLNNVFYKNDTLSPEPSYSGQVAIQFYFENNEFRNNIVWARPGTGQMIIHYVSGGTPAQRAFPAGNVFDNNIYYNSGSGYTEFGLNVNGLGGDEGNQSFGTLAAWRAVVGGEANSIVGDPGFVTATPSSAPAPTDFEITEVSLSRDRGQAAPGFVPALGEKDFFGASRVANGRVDAGMHEFMTVWQAWRDQHFERPDGGGDADADDDPDMDSATNLMEFSQGMVPTLSDAAKLPTGVRVGNAIRFSYRKAQSSLIYEVERSPTLPGAVDWLNVTEGEQNDGNGLFWRDVSIGGSAEFFQLKVTQP